MIKVAFLLRLVPYVLAAYVAWRKGFKWLTAAAIWVSGSAILNFFVEPAVEVRAAMGSVFAFLLFMHVLDLRPRR